MKRVFVWLAVIWMLFLSLSLPCMAEEHAFPDISLPPGLSSYFGSLPKETEDIASWLDTQAIMDFARISLEDALMRAAKGFLSLVAVAALCALMAVLSESVEQKGVMEAFGYLAVLGASSVTLSFLQKIFSDVAEHLETLSVFAVGIIPVYAGICTASGMGGLSVFGGNGLSLAASFAALLATQVLVPLLRVCFVLGFAASVSGISGISQISGSVRRFFVGMVGGVSTLLVAVFAFQTQIAAKSDTLAGRAVRYVTSTSLPLVGGALADASRTLSSAFSVMGGVVGGVGVAVVVLMLVPVMAELGILRICFLSASGMAEILSCHRIARLYRDAGALLGALMAITALVDAVLLFEFAILLRI